jgi:putative cell wall-binding protein
VGGDIGNATAIITRGDVFPDAIGASPLACAWQWPILLTESGGGAALNVRAAAALSELGITKALKVGTYVTLPGGVAVLSNLSGADRYATNRNVAEWAKNNAGLTFTHLAIATGDKFPDALASGPYLAKDGGTLLLSPLYGPLQAVTGAEITANRAAVCRVSFIACSEPVKVQVKARLP